MTPKRPEELDIRFNPQTVEEDSMYVLSLGCRYVHSWEQRNHYQTEYHAPTKREAIAEAKRKGWVFLQDHTTICPDCVYHLKVRGIDPKNPDPKPTIKTKRLKTPKGFKKK